MFNLLIFIILILTYRIQFFKKKKIKFQILGMNKDQVSLYTKGTRRIM